MAKRICLVGPMLSASGYVKTQGEILADLLEDDGYTIHRKSIYPNRILRFFDTVLFLLFKSSRYDVLILQVYGGLSFYLEDAASFLARFFRKEIIMTLHGGALPDFFKTRKRWAIRVLKRGNVVTCPSTFLIDQLRYLGISFLEIPNIIRIKDYPFVRRKRFSPRVLWMRAYHEIYNPHLAIDVFYKLVEKYPEATLTMAGPDMGLFDEIRKRCCSNPLNGSVTLLGKVDFAQKELLAVSHDIYLNTNRIDNAPVSMLEMAAFGLALVSSNVGGIPYLFQHGETAILCNQDSVSFVSAIDDIIQNSDQAVERSERARNFALRFDQDTVLMRWKNII